MCIDHTIRCTISKKWTFVHTEISFHHTIRAAYRVARSPVCSAQGAIPRSGDRRALVCARTCAPFSWTRDCTVPGGRTSPLERRRARARVGRSRVSCIGVCAVAVMFKGSCLGLGEGDWPGRGGQRGGYGGPSLHVGGGYGSPPPLGGYGDRGYTGYDDRGVGGYSLDRYPNSRDGVGVSDRGRYPDSRDYDDRGGYGGSVGGVGGGCGYGGPTRGAGMATGDIGVCTGGVRERPRRDLHCRVSAGRGCSGWASGEEKAGWVGVCLPGAGGGHRGARCCCAGGSDMRATWARVEGETLQGFEDNSTPTHTNARPSAYTHFGGGVSLSAVCVQVGLKRLGMLLPVHAHTHTHAHAHTHADVHLYLVQAGRP